MNNINLSQLADAAIKQCMADTTKVLGTDEISQVARLVLTLPDALVNAWRKEMTSGWMEIEGIFCHATPKAHWINPQNTSTPPKKKSPELCDLMILVERGVRRPADTEKRAILIQAKLGNFGQVKVDPDGPAVQRYMYANWPIFDLIGRPLPPLTRVNIAPNIPGDCKGSRYACIDVANQNWSLEATQAQVVSPFIKFNDYAGTISTTKTLGEELVAALAGKGGVECYGQWGILVNHLQHLAVARLFEERMPAGVKAQPIAKPLSHASRASTFVSRLENHLPASNRSYDDRIPYPFLEQGESIASTIPKYKQIEPRRGFGIIKIRTNNLTFSKDPTERLGRTY